MDNFHPDKVIHPGVNLQETLVASALSQIDLAQRTGLTAKTINEIIQGKNPVTPETAIKLAHVFGNSPNFWNNLQRDYEADVVYLESEEKLSDEIPNLGRFSICYSELAKYGYIKKTTQKKERIKNLLNFFGVSSLSIIPNVNAAVFRQSKHTKVNKESLAGWLRCGEVEGQRIETVAFDKDLLQKSIFKLKSLTQEENPQKLKKELEDICSNFGVALVLVPYFRNTYVNGAAWWLNSDKPVIQLSFKGHWIDSFWFTFFHEIGHLLKHAKKEQYIDYKGPDSAGSQKIEEEADKFANDTLIPDEEYHNFIKGRDFSTDAITLFAKRMGVSPAILAGKICHKNKNNPKVWKKFSRLRTRYAFST